MLEIKKATVDDAQVIALLGRVTYIQSHEVYFEEKADLLEYCNNEYSVSKIEKNLSDIDKVFLLATVNHLPVGFAILQLNTITDLIPSENVCMLQKIYVLADFISMKIGTQLHNAVLLEARKGRFEAIWLTVYYKNTKAISFYIKNGFKKLGSYNFKVGQVNYKNDLLSLQL